MTADAEPALAMAGVAKRLGRRTILSGLSAVFHHGEVTLIRAPRGAGKTTLARLACGQTTPDAGLIRRRGPAAPIVGAAAGFLSGMSALRGLDLRATAAGIDESDYIAAVAAVMDDPETLRRPFGEIVGRDRALLVYAAGWLIPAAVYVVDGAPLPADATVRERLWPLWLTARARGAVLWIADDKTGLGPFAPDRFLRLADGALAPEAPPPSPEEARAAIRAERERRAEAERAAIRAEREQRAEAERAAIRAEREQRAQEERAARERIAALRRELTRLGRVVERRRREAGGEEP